ncbi:MAG: hypothetical protein U0Z26_02350 [Anaerolineales bacterium]
MTSGVAFSRLSAGIFALLDDMVIPFRSPIVSSGNQPWIKIPWFPDITIPSADAYFQ